jgi:gamma-glutamyltranspeptidase/glutathione hydrolase
MTTPPLFPNIFVKHPATGRGGAVAAQHPAAAQAAVDVLEDGGNAVDAAVAASFALGATEPWMSGLGGGGFLLVRMDGDIHQLDFNMRAPLAATADQYPLAGGITPGMFAWPSVVDDRNTKGPMSICTPGVVAGNAAAMERFGSVSWQRVLAPAVELARKGMLVDWFTTLTIASTAADLAEHPSSVAAFMPDGFPPAQPTGHAAPTIHIPGLADTLQRLSDAGAEDFYRGDLAAAIARDLAAIGSLVDGKDLADYAASWETPDITETGGWKTVTTSGLTGGRTTAAMIAGIEGSDISDAAGFATDFVRAGDAAFRKRLAEMGHAGDLGRDACTSHISVVDRHGNLASLTQTLLGRFGSRVVLPDTGILMNNGMMWFDPTPERPNSIAPGAAPLANMSPMLLVAPDGRNGYALGASGGRHIIGTVAQVARRLIGGESPDASVTAPRAAVVTPGRASLDCRFELRVAEAVKEVVDAVDVIPPMVYPTNFACVGLAGTDGDSRIAVAEPSLPWPMALAADS